MDSKINGKGKKMVNSMMSTQHTPTPWFTRAARDLSGDIAITAEPAVQIVAEVFCDIRHPNEWAREECRANAAHIVRCVNSHDALLQALQDMIGCFGDMGGTRGPRFEAVQMARAALKAATEGA